GLDIRQPHDVDQRPDRLRIRFVSPRALHLRMGQPAAPSPGRLRGSSRCLSDDGRRLLQSPGFNFLHNFDGVAAVTSEPRSEQPFSISWAGKEKVLRIFGEGGEDLRAGALYRKQYDSIGHTVRLGGL